MGPLNGHLNAKRVGFIFIETWVGACIRQLQTTTSNARVSSPSKVFADEVKRSRGKKERKKRRSYFGNISFQILPCRLSLSPLFNDMLQNFVSWMHWEEEGGEIRRRGKKKTCPTPFLKISFFRQKRSSRGKPCLPDCLPRTSCCRRRGDVVVRGVEATVCGRLKLAGSRLRQINEKEGRLRAVREWSYFGFPFFGVERYSLVVSCWRRRVSWVASSSGGKKRGRGSRRRRADARRSSRANWRLLPLSGGLCRLLSKCPWEQKTERNAGR